MEIASTSNTHADESWIGAGIVTALAFGFATDSIVIAGATLAGVLVIHFWLQHRSRAAARRNARQQETNAR